MCDKTLIIGKFKKDLETLNINKSFYKIAKLFSCEKVCHKYRDGDPCVSYKVVYDDVHYCKGKVPVDTKVHLPYSPDYTQLKYSLKPLLSYVKAYNLLHETDPLKPAHSYRVSYFIEKYFEAVKFLKGLGDICASKLEKVHLYGGLCKDSYCKLAHDLKKIKCVLNDGLINLDNVVSDYNEIYRQGILVLSTQVGYPLANYVKKLDFNGSDDFDM